MPRTDDPSLPRVGVGGDFILCMHSVPYWPYLSVLLLCSVLLTLDGTTLSKNMTLSSFDRSATMCTNVIVPPSP